MYRAHRCGAAGGSARRTATSGARRRARAARAAARGTRAGAPAAPAPARSPPPRCTAAARHTADKPSLDKTQLLHLEMTRKNFKAIENLRLLFSRC